LYIQKPESQMSNSVYSRRLFLNSKNTMRKLTKFFKFLIVPVLIITGTVSCNKNELEVAPQDSGQSSSISKITTNKLGILEFKDMESFKQTVDELKVLTSEKRIVWEKEHGFTSLKSVYEEVLKGESEVLKKVEVKVDISKIKVSDFPNVHSEAYEKNINSITSTGNNILDTPSINIDVSDYANLVDKDGFAKIGSNLFQFKKSIIKASKIENDITPNDVEMMTRALKSDSKIKVISASSSSNKSSKVLQNGVKSTEGGAGGYLVRGIVEYSDSFSFASSDQPGAIYIPTFNFWVVPTIHYRTNMCVLEPSFWGWSLTGASGKPVAITSNLNIQNPFGQTDNDGNCTKDSYAQNRYVANGGLINASFYLHGYFTCTIFQNF
jgi:hypothetical protein